MAYSRVKCNYLQLCCIINLRFKNARYEPNARHHSKTTQASSSLGRDQQWHAGTRVDDPITLTSMCSLARLAHEIFAYKPNDFRSKTPLFSSLQ